MDPRALAVLEFPKICERLAERAAFSASRDLALSLAPSNGRRAVEQGLRVTSEARLLLELQPDFSVRSAHDVREATENGRMGGILDSEVLLEIRDTLESGAYVRSVVTRLAERLPLLADRAQAIDPCSTVVRAIKDSIGERGQVLDTASPELARVRVQLRTAYNRLMDALQRILDSAASRAQLQEPIITSRAGRYVVPVRAESRNQFRGIVHDESASGATVFMEPLATINLNNEWRHLQLEEEKEIERVLRHLSSLVGQFADQIIAGVNALATIDLALAKAKYAQALRATAPELEAGYSLGLIQARHPLLPGDAVPIDVYLGKSKQHVTPDLPARPSPAVPVGADMPQPRDPVTSEDGSGEDRVQTAEVLFASPPTSKDFIALVITGPNTGGKTVALKTVGLLQVMAQSGLHIPADAGSTVAVFEQIYADIGDEQSIEQSLSTFSSHMSNIVRILGDASGRSLVLLDELGAGTDPQEGSALARAILSHLVEQGIRTVATTHYSELKAYAYSEPGVQNASVEFDVETLRPTYRLIIGLPGRSNALAIAQRLGLPQPILESARAFVAPGEAHLEALLSAIQTERDAAREERVLAQDVRTEAERRRQALERRLAEIEDERASKVEQAQREAQSLLETARQQIRRAEQQVAVAGGDRLMVAQATREIQQATQEMTSHPVPRRPQLESMLPDELPIGIGDRVELRRLNAVGQVLTEPNVRGEVEVQLGNFRTRTNVRELSRVSKREADRRQSPANAAPLRPAGFTGRTEEPAVRLPAPPSVRMELDVRGTRADDVLPIVERYLSDAYLGGMPFVRIIHGKGTGALRQIIRDFLNDNPLVHDYEAGSPNDGGEGATVVKLAV